MSAAASVVAASGAVGRRPPRVPGALPGLGHLLALRRDPVALLWKAHRTCGEIGELRLARRPLVMLYGEEAHEAFFRAPDEQLDQAAAYPFMKPIFGEGVVFDASPEERKRALRNQSLRDQFMRGHAEVIAAETERMLARVGDAGEIDLLDFLAELTIYTSSACLIGKAFREELGPEFAALYADLERGTDALAYVNPYLPLPSFRRRDRARARLVELMQGIIDRRAASEARPGDLLDVLTRIRHEDGSPRFDANTITGMFISMMFAGHHTTSGTAAWTMIELLRHPGWMARVVAEQDALAAQGEEPSYLALRAMPVLEAVLKETLRLHPPLILLMRKVMEPFAFREFVVEPGALVGVSPAVSNRMPEHFPEPERFDPDRYAPGREEDRRVFAWIPFGAGRHRCVGAAFAMMQLKAIFAVLLRRRAFALAQAPGSYRDDLSKMVIQLAQPARVRMEPRTPAAASTVRPDEAPGASAPAGPVRTPAASAAGALRVEVDLDLCQGHGTCVAEAPEVFALDAARAKVRLRCERPAAAQREAVRAAARHCPTRAITVRED